MNKVKFILGLFFSFCVAIVIGYISVFQIGIGWAFAPLYMIAFTSIPFLVINSVFFLVFKLVKTEEIKNGIKWGYLFVIIYVLFGLYLYISNYSLYQEVKRGNEDADKIINASEISDCDEIIDVEGKNICIERIAKKEQNPTYCEKIINDLSSKELCYVDALENSSDKNLIKYYCSIIQNKYHKENCNSLLEK